LKTVALYTGLLFSVMSC